jgi:hypothetical protein
MGTIATSFRDPAAWTAATFKGPGDYTLVLSDADRQELLTSVRRLEAAGRLLPTTSIGRADFALGPLGERLEQAFEQVRSGYGFVVLKGLPRAGVSFEQFAAIVWGVGTYFGSPLSQSAAGELLSSVIDATAIEETPRMYRSALQLGLHTDPTAMLSLACWNAAKSGGESVLGSGIAVHAEIAKRAPHLLAPLYRGFHYHRLGEEGADQEPVTPYRVPVFGVRDGQVSVRTARAGYIAGHHALNIPISDLEIEAIDLFDAIARRPGNSVMFQLDPGDMTVVNNYVVMHARKAFEDHSDPERKRHLLRLWLDAPTLRAVPAEFNQMGTANGIPYQRGRHCTYDFKKLFREVDPKLLGFKPQPPQRTEGSSP